MPADAVAAFRDSLRNDLQSAIEARKPLLDIALGELALRRKAEQELESEKRAALKIEEVSRQRVNQIQIEVQNCCPFGIDQAALQKRAKEAQLRLGQAEQSHRNVTNRFTEGWECTLKGGIRHFDTWKNRSKSGVEARNIVNMLARASLWRSRRPTSAGHSALDTE